MICFRFLLLLFLFVPFAAPSLFSQDVAPAGSSSEVLLKKEKEKAQEKILAGPAYEEPELIEEEKPESPITPEIRFRLDRVRAEGDDEIVSTEELRPFFAAVEGREITFRELDKVRRKIEKLYRAKGYFASVFMPPQRIEQGEVAMRILIYKMGDLKIEDQKYSRAWKIRSFWRIPRGERIQYQKLRNGVAAMNQNPDRTVKSYIKAGKEAGVVDIYLKVTDHFPVHGGYSFDNQGVRLTGKLRHGFTARHNNLLGLDDIFLIGTSFSHSFGAIFLQHLVPVNSRGTRFLWGFSHAQVQPKREFKSLGINSTSENYTLQLRQRLFTNPHFAGDAYLGYEFKEKKTEQLSVTSTWDKLRVLSMGGDFQIADFWGGFWQIGQALSFGLPFRGDGFPLTSRGGESSFFKYGFSAKRAQKLFKGTGLAFKIQGQLTPDKLTPQEQLFMGGMDTIRGYPESDYGADNGILSRTEYQVPAFFFPKDWRMPKSDEPLRSAITLVSFFDHGYGSIRRPGDDEHDNHQMFSTGGGFRIRFRENISAAFEWGVRLGDEELTEGGGPSLFHFVLNLDV